MAERRPRRAAATASLAAALAIAVAAAFAISNAAAAGAPSHATTAMVAELNLSRGDLYDAISVVDGRLLLSGGHGDGDSLLPSGAGAASPHSPPGRCETALVDPATLTLSDEQHGGCEDPRLYGLDVLPINFIDNGTTNGSSVRIAHATPGGGYRIGPVVMTYSEYSDTDAEWVYGDGDLWIYDCLTTRGSVLLRVSQRTGAVLQLIHMPDVDRPLLDADGDGLWLAPAVNSGFEPPSANGVYRVAPGMSRPVLVTQLNPEDDVAWIVASGHSVWLDVNHAGRTETLMRFNGENRTAVLDVSARPRSNFDVDFGSGQPSYAGDATDGLWTVGVQLPDYPQQRVARIDPTTGRSVTVATIAPPDGYQMEYRSPPVVLMDGSLFFLDPPELYYPGGGAGQAVSGPSVLYRVTPS
ncbi:MAG: hypothetical protein ABR947_09095 [Solirubrobacteraceae bacterium]